MGGSKTPGECLAPISVIGKQHSLVHTNKFGHVDLPDYDHIIDCLVDLNEKEALLTEAWGNRRCGGFSKERHINLMKEVLGE